MKGDRGAASTAPLDERRIDETTRLDGNAAAGMLSEIFTSDVTAARTTCANCGVSGALGALLVYGHAMGMVMRCPSCDAVVMRIVRMHTHVCLDPSGAKLVVVAAS